MRSQKSGITHQDTTISLEQKRSTRKTYAFIRASTARSFMEKILYIDIFQESFQFQLPNGESSLPTYTGCFFSTILYFMVLLYGSLELAAVIARDNSDVTFLEIDTYFNDSYVFA